MTQPARTQKQVNALWPDADEYTFTATVRFLARISGVREGRDLLQRLYEGEQACAGSFEIDAHGDPTRYSVTFIRDVSDDFEVVNDRLLYGFDFALTLKVQLIEELKEAIRSYNLPLEITIISGPDFSL